MLLLSPFHRGGKSELGEEQLALGHVARKCGSWSSDSSLTDFQVHGLITLQKSGSQWFCQPLGRHVFSVWDLTHEGHDPPLRDLGPLLMSELLLERAVEVELGPVVGVKQPGP